LANGGGVVNFKYNDFGRRIQKSGPSGTTNYLYDGNNLTAEIDQAGAVITRYTFGQQIDQPLGELRSSALAFYHADGQGSITSLTSSGGVLSTTYTYDSYGQQTASSENLSNFFRYTAREFDTESGIYEYRMRYYDASVGRFLSEDPIGFLGGSNFYRYVRNSPSRFIDPSGMVLVPNGTNAQNQDYQTAINYLSRDPQMASIISELQNSSTLFIVDFNNNDDDSFDPNTNTVHWDPHSGCGCPLGTQSAALGLGHELGHAETPHLGNLLGLFSIFAGDYDNWEEARVITGLETEVAQTLGEPTRPNHRCDGFPHELDPTAHTPVVYPREFTLGAYERYVLLH
jgi:RHS repeat-associated protein